jgi:hypothetical protein
MTNIYDLERHENIAVICVQFVLCVKLLLFNFVENCMYQSYFYGIKVCTK